MNTIKSLKVRKVVLVAIILFLAIFTYLSIWWIDNNSLSHAGYDQNLKASIPASNAYTADNNQTTIKILIYNGYDALPSSVNGIKNCLNYLNSHNSVNNLKFSYNTSDVINSATLSSYDVLIMPGGTSGISYLNNPKINDEDIKEFVSNGKGYVGICAGSYSACNYIYGYYHGWGIAPNVNCRVVNYVGQLSVLMTSSGSNITGYSGIQTIYHWNGPAMYKIGPATTLATYNDGDTDYMNFDAIVMDNYGSGKVVLSGPHPELEPAKPEMLGRMIIQASNKTIVK